MTRQKLGFTIATILILMALLIGYCSKSMNTIVKDEKQRLDSMQVARIIDRKQFDHAQSVLLNEITGLNKELEKLRSKNSALYEASTNEVNSYKALVKRLRQTAQKDCQPYIDSLDQHCNKGINAKDSVIGKLSDIIITQDSIVLAQDTLIGLQKGEILKERELSDQKTEYIKNQDKQLKRAKFWNKVVGWTAVTAIAIIGAIGLVN